MNIKNTIKESIKQHIFESLKTQKQKYGESNANNCQRFDPSTTYKYTEQICKFMYDNKIPSFKVKEYVKKYDDLLKRNLISKEYKDINKIKTFDDLKDIVDNTNTISKTQNKKIISDLQKVKDVYYDTINGWDIYKPLNTLQQIILGKGTRWCISQTKSKNYFNDYFVLDSSRFYIFIKNNEKYQLLIEPNYERYIYDANDDMILEENFIKKTGINVDNFKWFPLNNKTSVYSKDGELWGYIKDNMYTGIYYYYYVNGKIKEIIHYKNDELDGKDIQYDSNGNIEKCEIYKDGILIKRCDKINNK